MRTRGSALLLVLLLSACSDKKPAPAAAPVVVEVRGEVSQAGRALVAGDRVTLDTDVVVGNGRVTIELPDGATLRLYADTRLRLASKQTVRLFVGKVWALIAPRFEDHFQVETDNAVAGVRGTELIVEASGRRTRVAVVAGEVEVANANQPSAAKKVTKGQQVIVEAEAPPTTPAAFDPEVEEKAWDELGELPAPAPENPEPGEGEPDEGEPDEGEPDEGEPDKAKKRPRNRLEREGEETKRRLIEEGKRTERQLKRESAATKKKLEREEDAIRQKLEEDEKRAREGGSVKDFLD